PRARLRAGAAPGRPPDGGGARLVAGHDRPLSFSARGLLDLELLPEGRPRAGVALALDAEAARVRPGAPAAPPHHDEVPGPVARHRRAVLIARRVRVHLELAPDGRPRAVVALALDAGAAVVRG